MLLTACWFVLKINIWVKLSLFLVVNFILSCIKEVIKSLKLNLI